MSTVQELQDEIRSTEAHIEDMQAHLNILKEKLHNKIANENMKMVRDATKYEWHLPMRTILQQTFKLNDFRHLQMQSINAVLENRDIIVAMPPGSGKSLCYQLPALLTNGITLVIQPLPSLIDDQIIALKKLEIDATTQNLYTSTAELERIHGCLCKGTSTIKLIYVTPEWMAQSVSFMACLKVCHNRGNLDRIVIDEVHCCAKSGPDYRPSYALLGSLKSRFPVPIIGLTSVGSKTVIAEAQTMLNIDNCIVLRTWYDRPNLFYGVRQKPTTLKKCGDYLEEYLTRTYKNKSGIIYTMTVLECEELEIELKDRGLSVACYHECMNPILCLYVHEKWLNNQYQVIIATSAFGMGIDKPDVRFVIHQSIPKCIEQFEQESGRAGRDGQRADCIIFYTLNDVFRQSSRVSTTPKCTINLTMFMGYCIEVGKCRRIVEVPTQCNKMCDNCQDARAIKNIDITEYCNTIIHTINFATKTVKGLTATKLLDYWFKGDFHQPVISREMAERIIAHMMIRNYLSEDVRFAGRDTEAYLTKGPENLPKQIVIKIRKTSEEQGSPNNKKKKIDKSTNPHK